MLFLFDVGGLLKKLIGDRFLLGVGFLYCWLCMVGWNLIIYLDYELVGGLNAVSVSFGLLYFFSYVSVVLFV